MSEPAIVRAHPLRKTKAQLVEEVESLRLRVAELEDAAGPHEWQGRASRESEESKVSGLGAIAADVTERKHAGARRTLASARAEVSVDGNLREQNFDELIGMFAHAPIGLCCFDRDLRFIFINDYLAALNGISVEEHQGRSIREVIPDIAAGVEKQLRQVFETRESIIGGTVDAETPAHPGRIRSFQHHYYAIKSEAGTVLRVACVVQEVTARKRTEVALRESEERLKAITNAVPAGISYFDREQRFRFANAKYESLLGLKPSELAGMTLEEAIGKEPYKVARQYVQRVLSGQTAQFENTLPAKNGGKISVAVSYVPDIGPDRRVTGFFALVQDITERKRAEEALQEAREELESRVDARTKDLHDANQKLGIEIATRRGEADRFEALLEAGPDPSISVDPRGRIIEVNAQVENVLGYQRDELIGQDLEILVPDQLQGRHIGHRQAYIRNPSSRRMGTGLELAVTCKDGRELPVEISLSPARVAGKRIVIASIRDITERKRIEEELHGLSARLINAQEEERKRIARELHDDFNQRLALVTIDIEQLSRERAGSPEDFDSHIRSLLGRIEELSLDVHRLSHRLHPAALDHLGLVTAVKSLCQEMSALHDFRIHFTGRKIPDVVPNDVALCCYRIAQEALRNVIKHSGAREAHVELARTKQGLELRVRDQGAGFDMAETESRGGLGLISMRERLRLVGGQITIKSSAAHGTEVDVLVPLSAADAV